MHNHAVKLDVTVVMVYLAWLPLIVVAVALCQMTLK